GLPPLAARRSPRAGSRRGGGAHPAMKGEEMLSGGNDGQTTRHGDRVYRTAGPWTPGVQRLMRHLRDAGLDWVPEPLGMDDRGREIVQFLPGEVPNYPLPAYVWNERTL